MRAATAPALVAWRPVTADNALPMFAARYIHVSIMIFIGFGFLMTFLKRYSNSAVALNFFTSCLVCVHHSIDAA